MAMIQTFFLSILLFCHYGCASFAEDQLAYRAAHGGL